jgi:hypothetical protein
MDGVVQPNARTFILFRGIRAARRKHLFTSKAQHGDYQSQKSFTTPMMEPSTPLYSGPQPSITDTYGEGFPGQMIESGQRNKDDRGSEQQGNDIC